jgi:hypothetical protein
MSFDDDSNYLKVTRSFDWYDIQLLFEVDLEETDRVIDDPLYYVIVVRFGLYGLVFCPALTHLVRSSMPSLYESESWFVCV